MKWTVWECNSNTYSNDERTKMTVLLKIIQKFFVENAPGKMPRTTTTIFCIEMDILQIVHTSPSNPQPLKLSKSKIITFTKVVTSLNLPKLIQIYIIFFREHLHANDHLAETQSKHSGNILISSLLRDNDNKWKRVNTEYHLSS